MFFLFVAHLLPTIGASVGLVAVNMVDLGARGELWPRGRHRGLLGDLVETKGTEIECGFCSGLFESRAKNMFVLIMKDVHQFLKLRGYHPEVLLRFFKTKLLAKDIGREEKKDTAKASLT